MKNGWKTVPLEALAIQQKGAIKIGPFGSQLKKCDLVRSGIHVVGIENVLSETFDGLGGRFISAKKFQTLRTVEILPGDLLITMMGTIGKVAIVPDGTGTSIMDSHLLRVRPDRKLCRTDYLAWAIYGSPAVQQAMDAQAHGAIMRGLNSAIVRSLPILLPPLPEQKRIVGFLDDAFAGIATAKANAEKNFQNARALFESHLQSVFSQRGKGWVEKKLDEVCAITSSLIDPRKKEFLDLVHVGAGNIESKNGALVELKTAREEALISGKFLFDESAVLYSKIRPYLMKVARPDFSGLCSADMYPLTPLPNQITRDFLFHLLLSKRFTEYAIQGSARAGMPKVNREHLFEFSVWLPSVNMQNELAAKLDALSAETQRLESIYQQKLAALEALKKSLLHQAFSGQL